MAKSPRTVCATIMTGTEFPWFAIADIRRSMQRIEEALTDFEAGKAKMSRAAE